MICLNPIGGPGGGQSRQSGYLFWFPELGLVTDIILICQAPARAVGSCGQRAEATASKQFQKPIIQFGEQTAAAGWWLAGGWGSTLPIKLINLLSPLHRLRSAF